jgi:ArsR family transcriptional regulator
MGVSGPQAVEMLRAAGEPTRLRILALLAREELAVMELGQVLGQSQPRVSRHLKLLAEAGLIERFPDGAWVFYRVSAAEPAHGFVGQVLALASGDTGELVRDAERLAAVHSGRAAEAASYFARMAGRWDEIRSLHTAEAAVEAAILKAAGRGPFKRLVDLGSGTGRMLALLGPLAERSVGLDQSQQMLNIARSHVADQGLTGVELRHGDIFRTGLPDAYGDLVVVHQVLHYLSDPAAAVAEAGRLVAPGGKLLIVDFAPHDHESLRASHQHRRLGFADAEMDRWLAAAGLKPGKPIALKPDEPGGLTVKVWCAGKG